MKRFQVGFWLIWMVIMAIQSLRSVLWCIEEPVIGWKLACLGAGLLYALFSYGAWQLFRATRKASPTQ